MFVKLVQCRQYISYSTMLSVILHYVTFCIVLLVCWFTSLLVMAHCIVLLEGCTCGKTMVMLGKVGLICSRCPFKVSFNVLYFNSTLYQTFCKLMSCNYCYYTQDVLFKKYIQYYYYYIFINQSTTNRTLWGSFFLWKWHGECISSYIYILFVCTISCSLWPA